MNLLSNAIKFTREGGVTLRAGGERVSEVDSGKKAGSEVLLVFEVEDTGMGIALDEVEMLSRRLRRRPPDGEPRRAPAWVCRLASSLCS